MIVGTFKFEKKMPNSSNKVIPAGYDHHGILKTNCIRLRLMNDPEKLQRLSVTSGAINACVPTNP